MTGTDDAGGSGVGSFALYVSTDGGPFVLDQSDIPAQAGSDGTYTGSITFAGAGEYLRVLQRGDRQRRQRRGGHRGAQATTTVPPQSTLTAVSGAGPYAGTATLTATLVYGTSPVAGKLVTFSLVIGGNTTSVGSATTNASGVATLSGVSLAGLSAGTDSGSVVASFAGDATYAATSASGNLVVTPVDADDHLGEPGDIVTGTPLGSAQLDATASVPGTFAYSPRRGHRSGRRSGTDPVGDLHAHRHHRLRLCHRPPRRSTSQQATPTITWANPADITYGTPLGATQLDATASVPGTFAYSPAAGTILKAGTGQVLSVTFTPYDSIDYTAVTTTATINVNQATATDLLGQSRRHHLRHAAWPGAARCHVVRPGHLRLHARRGYGPERRTGPDPVGDVQPK